eukprot:3250636-Pleurochrysis_carterae.AAC.1
MARAQVSSSAVGGHSTLLATGLCDGGMVVWDMNTRNDKYVLQRHGAQVLMLAFYKVRGAGK